MKESLLTNEKTKQTALVKQILGKSPGVLAQEKYNLFEGGNSVGFPFISESSI